MAEHSSSACYSLNPLRTEIPFCMRQSRCLHSEVLSSIPGSDYEFNPHIVVYNRRTMIRDCVTTICEPLTAFVTINPSCRSAHRAPRQNTDTVPVGLLQIAAYHTAQWEHVVSTRYSETCFQLVMNSF